MNWDRKLVKKFSLQSDLWTYLIVAILGVCSFIITYGYRVINPFYTEWIVCYGGDTPQHYLGWLSYKAGSLTFPLGMTNGLTYPNDTSIVYYDSIPLFAVFFRIFAGILPKDFQYFGLWGLISTILQGILTCKIVKKYTDSRIYIIASGFLMTLIPCVIFKMFLHTALAGQWIVIMGLMLLFLYEDYLDNPKNTYIHVALMAFISSMVHAYFILLSGMILCGFLLFALLKKQKLWRLITYLVEYLVICVLVYFILGAFSGGVAASDSGLGIFSFNLLGWFVFYGNFDFPYPARNESLQFANFEQFEGFSYLGAGFFALLIAAIVYVVFLAVTNKESIKKYGKLLIAILVLGIICVVLAASPRVTLGQRVLFEYQIPDVLRNVWSIFRATGRIIWPLTYILMLGSLIIVARIPKKIIINCLIIVAVILQILDIRSLIDYKRHRYMADVTYFADQFISYDMWIPIGESGDYKHAVFGFDPDAMTYIFGYWCLQYDITMNRFYLARDDSERVISSLEEEYSDLRDDTLYIFREDNINEMSKYPLHYYQDGIFFIGTVNEIEGFEEYITAE